LQFKTKIIKAFLTIGLVCSGLNAETITHNGFTYGTVTSPYTGRVWLDRNLGASRVCTALDDAECYGDYYQWGRGTDGHEKTNSATTSTLATDITASSANGSFIITLNNSDWTTADSDGSLRAFEWSKIDGTSICPVGYRVPTIDELTAETINTSTAVTNNTDAFNHFLKLPSAGYRYGSDGSLYGQASNGVVWSSSVSGSYSQSLYFGSGGAYTSYGLRANGLSVRCIRDESYSPPNQLPTPNPGQNQTSYKGDPITLSASNSTDSDGNITNYEWSENGTILSTDANFTKYDFSVGVHTITLKVTDDDNATAEANVTVTINDFPVEPIYANGTFTSSIDYINSQRVYEFTLDEKSRVSIKASSDAMKVGAWIVDANSTKLSTLADWEAGENSQFYYDAVLEAGTYTLELFSQDANKIGDFSFSFNTQPYNTITPEPWIVNIPTSRIVTTNELVVLYLDIEPTGSNDISQISVTSNNLPSNWSLENPTGYGYKLDGTVDAVDNFSITLNITDGNFSQEHIINFQVKPLSVNALIGEGEGGRLAIKQYSDNNSSEPFKVAFGINIATENIRNVLCQFNDNPILNMQAVYDTNRHRYTCNASVTPLMDGAINELDFMNKLENIPEDERYMSVIVNQYDGTTFEYKVLQNIKKETLGDYLKIKNLDNSFTQNDKNISIGILTSNKDYTETADIANQTFNIEYGSEIHLNAGKWSLVIDNHELLIEIPDDSLGLAFVANKDLLKEDVVLELSYAKSLNGTIKIYAQRIKNDVNAGFRLAPKILPIWFRTTNQSDSFEIYDGPGAVAVRGTTFSMNLTN